MLHTVGKLLTRATTLLQTSSRSKVYTRSYAPSKLRDWRSTQEVMRLQSSTIEGLHKKLCAFKIAGVPIVAISGLPLGSLMTKSHLDVAPVERHRIYYKGEGGGFPQVQAVVNLVCPGCPWLVLAPKVLQLCTNHFVLVLCRSVRMSKACHFFLVLSQSSSTPLYPSIVLRARERAPTPCSSDVFSLGLTFESLKEFGVRQVMCFSYWCVSFYWHYHLTCDVLFVASS